MGILLWLAAALLAVVIARIVPLLHASLIAESAAALVGGGILGIAATALDFGGWNEPDWRAALFVLFGTLAVIGVVRLANRP